VAAEFARVVVTEARGIKALKSYADGCEARAGIAAWVVFYNATRPHQALDGRIPLRMGEQPGGQSEDRVNHDTPVWSPS
jgi:hypothetical protein